MAVKFLPDLVNSYFSTEPRHYTSSPFTLLRVDVLIILRNFYYVLYIPVPLWPWASGKLDETYLGFQNLISLGLQGFLTILQLAFIFSLPLFVVLPLGTALLYVAAILVLNAGICRILNGSDRHIHMSKPDLSMFPKRENERWIFLNGVAVGYAPEKQSPLIFNYSICVTC